MCVCAHMSMKPSHKCMCTHVYTQRMKKCQGVNVTVKYCLKLSSNKVGGRLVASKALLYLLLMQLVFLYMTLDLFLVGSSWFHRLLLSHQDIHLHPHYYLCI